MHLPYRHTAPELREHVHLDDAAFAQRFGRAMLMLHANSDGAAERINQTRLGQTGTHSLDELRTGDAFIAFLPVMKSARNEFNFIAIGRTGNNDVVIGDSTLSKFHAFIREENGTWLIVDAGSRNGTMVDGIKVPVRGSGMPLQLTLLKPCEIRFGVVSTTLLPIANLRKFIGVP